MSFWLAPRTSFKNSDTIAHTVCFLNRIRRILAAPFLSRSPNGSLNWKAQHHINEKICIGWLHAHTWENLHWVTARTHAVLPTCVRSAGCSTDFLCERQNTLDTHATTSCKPWMIPCCLNLFNKNFQQSRSCTMGKVMWWENFLMARRVLLSYLQAEEKVCFGCCSSQSLPQNAQASDHCALYWCHTSRLLWIT